MVSSGVAERERGGGEGGGRCCSHSELLTNNHIVLHYLFLESDEILLVAQTIFCKNSSKAIHFRKSLPKHTTNNKVKYSQDNVYTYLFSFIPCNDYNKTQQAHLDPTGSIVVILVKHFQNELMVEVYSKSLVRSIGEV